MTIFLMSLLSYFEVSWITPEHIASLGYFAAGLVILGVILVVSSRPNKKVQPSAKII